MDKHSKQFRAVESLGPTISRHRGSTINAIAGYVISLIVFSLAIEITVTVSQGVQSAVRKIPWYSEKNWCWFAVISLSCLAAGLAYGAFLIWRFASRLLDRHVTIHELGISIEEQAEEKTIPWNRVSRIVEVELKERLPILKFPFNLLLPRWKSRFYEIWVDDQTDPINFDNNSIADLKKFADNLKSAAKRGGVRLFRRKQHDL